MKTKRFILLLLLVCMFISIIPSNVSAAELDYANGTCGNNLSWVLSTDGVLTISGYGDMSNFTYQSYVPWDDFRDLINTVVIQNGVTSIGRYAFVHCKNLKKVLLPESMTKMEFHTFQFCTSLESIVLPNLITKIPESAFSGCTNLKNVSLPNNLQWIDNYAFSDCTSLETVILPSTVTSTGNYAFQNCTNLKTVYLPNSLTGLYSTFKNCTSLSSITIPSQIDTLSDAFSGCTSLRKVIFSGDAPTISDWAFYNVSATCYYPYGNKTWTIAKMADYNGNLDWAPYFDELYTANTTTSGKIKLTWDKIDGAVKYKVYRASTFEGKYAKVKTTSKTSYTDKSAEAGKYYFYYVKAFDSSGNELVTSSAVMRICKLARPTVTAKSTASTGKTKLSWDAIDGAAKYVVYRATSKSGEYTKVKTTTSTSYTDSSAKVGKAYYYKVVAVHETSAANSAKSAAVSSVRDLARPTVTVKNTASTGKTKLSWDAVSGAEKYVVYRATSKNGEYTKVKTTTSTSYTDSSAKVGKAYYYKVVAVHAKSAANSAKSKVVSGTRDLARPTASVKVNSNGDPKVSWEKVSGAEKYYVYRATSKDGEYTRIKSTTKASYTDTSAKAGKTYYYKVKAIHSTSAANSASSAVVKAKAK